MSSIRSISKLRTVPLFRSYSQKPSAPTGGSPAAAAPPKPKNPAGVDTSNVTGLTSYVVVKKPAEVKPTDEYKVPEYFCYDRFSYHGAEVELAKYRCPQPSSKGEKY